MSKPLYEVRMGRQCSRFQNRGISPCGARFGAGTGWSSLRTSVSTVALRSKRSPTFGTCRAGATGSCTSTAIYAWTLALGLAVSASVCATSAPGCVNAPDGAGAHCDVSATAGYSVTSGNDVQGRALVLVGGGWLRLHPSCGCFRAGAVRDAADRHGVEVLGDSVEREPAVTTTTSSTVGLTPTTLSEDEAIEQLQAGSGHAGRTRGHQGRRPRRSDHHDDAVGAGPSIRRARLRRGRCTT